MQAFLFEQVRLASLLAFASVQTGQQRHYANIIVKKGVLPPKEP